MHIGARGGGRTTRRAASGALADVGEYRFGRVNEALEHLKIATTLAAMTSVSGPDIAGSADS